MGGPPTQSQAELYIPMLTHDTYRLAEGSQEVWYQCTASLKGMCTPSTSNTGYDCFM